MQLSTLPEDPFAAKYPSIAIKPMPGHQFEFTRRWFKTRNQQTWSHFLKEGWGDGRPIRMLQIGVFEGMDLVWCFQNILTHPDSRCLAIDPWLATRKLDQEYMDAVRRRAIHNLSPWNDKWVWHAGKSQIILPELIELNHPKFDLAVIDGDHNAPVVFKDAENCLRLVRSGGWIVFDDVRNRHHKRNHVADGLDRFLRYYGDEVKVIWKHRYCDCVEVL
jgi:hypothetical protein